MAYRRRFRSRRSYGFRPRRRRPRRRRRRINHYRLRVGRRM